MKQFNYLIKPFNFTSSFCCTTSPERAQEIEGQENREKVKKHS